MKLSGTKTEKNLQTAFSGESMARNKYTFFAEKARQEGQEEIAALFERMAKNESIHGKLLYKLLHNGIQDTTANLKDAMDGEYGEWTSMYPDFAKTARDEGLTEVADLFDKIALIEKDHEYSFLKALAKLSAAGREQEGASANAKAEKHHAVTVEGYRCMFCGAVYEERPDYCKVCGAIGSFEKTSIQKEM